MDDNIKAEEAELLTKQITITDREAFEKAVEELGSDKSKAEAIAAQTQKTITEKLDTDPKFYQSFSEKIEEIIDKMRENKIADIEALKQMKLIEDEVNNKKDDSIPEEVKAKVGADIFYRNLQDEFARHNISGEEYEKNILDIFDILKGEAIVDWYKNSEVKRVMYNRLDDYFYDELNVKKGIKFSSEEVKEIIDKTIKLATGNNSLF